MSIEYRYQVEKSEMIKYVDPLTFQPTVAHRLVEITMLDMQVSVYPKQEVRAWLDRCLPGRWAVYTEPGGCYFEFESSRDLTWFKLRWA